MKKRLCSAAIGLSVLALILCFYETVLFNIAVGVICAIGIYELIRASGLEHSRLFLILGIGFGALSPFFYIPPYYDLRILAVILFVFLFFILLLRLHNAVDIGKLSFACGSSIALSLSLCCLIYIREDVGEFTLYYIFLVFIISWVCDGGAYFTGRFLGKHQLAPIISPKKTIEGLIGGFLSNILFVALITAIFCIWIYPDVSLHILPLISVTLIGTCLGVIGDLVASAVKRQFGIKDFGNILPGHGGVIDRFDSILFVLPTLYLIVKHFPILGG